MENPYKYFMFMVDDMLFYNYVDIKALMDKFEGQTNCFSLHLKLSPSIQYSHTSDKFIKLPDDFLKIPLSEEDGHFILKYKREQTHLDWNYPFDFCGSLYQSIHV